MISNFKYITETGLELDLNLSMDKALFAGNDRADISAFYKSSSNGVKWYNETKGEITFLESDIYLVGYPTPDMEKVIIIYPMDHDTYHAPNNAIIYNADGSVHIQLHAPEPISELSKTRARNLAMTKSFNPPYRLYFDGVSWANVKGNVETVVKIGFDRDWWEERVLYPETGEFGECLSSGMR